MKTLVLPLIGTIESKFYWASLAELDDPDVEIQVGTLKIDGAGDTTQTVGVKRLEVHPSKEIKKNETWEQN